MGSYREGTTAPAPDWDVDIYLDMGDGPAFLVYSDAAVVASADVDGDVTIDLNTPAELPAGNYWISMVANMAFGNGNQFYVPFSLVNHITGQKTFSSERLASVYVNRDLRSAA